MPWGQESEPDIYPFECDIAGGSFKNQSSFPENQLPVYPPSGTHISYLNFFLWNWHNLAAG